MFPSESAPPLRITPGDSNLLRRSRGLTRNTLLISAVAATLLLATVIVTILLLVNRADAAAAEAEATAAQTHLRNEVATLKADRDAQSDRADAAASGLASCASAYNDQKSVTDDLRSAVRASYSAVSVTLLGGSDDTSSIIAEIREINSREAAIDASACASRAGA